MNQRKSREIRRLAKGREVAVKHTAVLNGKSVVIIKGGTAKSIQRAMKKKYKKEKGVHNA